MATVSDSIAATVTLKAGDAIRDLGAVAKGAKTAEQRINELQAKGSIGLGKVGDASVRGAKGVDELADRTKRASLGVGDLRRGVGQLQNNLGAFAAAGAVVGTLSAGILSTVNAQSRLKDVTNASRVTFKEASGEVEKFAEGATKIGLSKRAAIEASTGFGALFRSIGFSTTASAGFSTSLTTLSADLASTFGGSVEEASGALRALFRGEGDPIEKYNIKVTEAATTQRALQLGLAGTAGQLTEQDKTLARLTLAYTASVAAQGDFSRTQADTANQQRVLTAQSENLKASLGQTFTPAYTSTITGANVALGSVEGTLKKLGGSASGAFKTFVSSAIPGVAQLIALGDAQKDTASNFKDGDDALKTFAQELAAGREGSEAYAAAVSFLKKANVDAETAGKKLGDAISDQTTKLAQARQETSANVSAVQSLASAQRGAQDATIRVTDSRRNLADAERSLGDLRRKGKVDAEKVADSEQRVRDASQSTADARVRYGDAEKRLGDLRRTGAVDAKQVVDAERSIADASRGVASARRAVADAEKEVARLRAGPTGDESKDAARAIIRSQLDLEQAQNRQLEAQQALNDSRGIETLGAARDLRNADLSLAEATDAVTDAQKAQVDLNNRGATGSQLLTEAEQRLLDARQQAEDATHRQTEAEAALRTARAGDPDFNDNLARAAREVEAARRGIESATRAEDTAARDLRTARAGDPDFDTRLARAGDDVTRARRELIRAEQDLPRATIGARLAQEDFNAKVSAGTPEAYRLAQTANQLGIQYDYVAGAAGRAQSAIARIDTGAFSSIGGVLANLGQSVFAGGLGGAIGRRAAGGPVSASTPYVVGERGPELFVPHGPGTIIPNGAGSSASTVVHTSIVLDGREVARAVTVHQRGASRQGGDVFAR